VDGEAPLLSAGTVIGRRLAGATPEEHRASQERVACRREMGIDRERLSVKGWVACVVSSS
jgi:hypothetical protein